MVLCITSPAAFGHVLHHQEHQSITTPTPFSSHITCLYSSNNRYLLKKEKTCLKKKHMRENELFQEGHYMENNAFRDRSSQKEYPLEMRGAPGASWHTSHHFSVFEGGKWS